MRNVILLAFAAMLLLPIAACTVTPTDLHPISGTREGLEQFKDDSTN
jgi:hypothetical protein